MERQYQKLFFTFSFKITVFTNQLTSGLGWTHHATKGLRTCKGGPHTHSCAVQIYRKTPNTSIAISCRCAVLSRNIGIFNWRIQSKFPACARYALEFCFRLSFLTLAPFPWRGQPLKATRQMNALFRGRSNANSTGERKRMDLRAPYINSQGFYGT